jgi:protein-S-isoprenylcysteine O-methyltransferase Ste14
MQGEVPRSRWLLVPPPPVFVVSFLVGMQLGSVLGLHLGGGGGAVAGVMKAVGAVLVAVGGCFLISAPAMFAWHRTTIIPHGRAGTLLTAGPYRVTRNPMYLGLTLLYVGLALVLNQPVPLLFLPLPLWMLSTKTIPYEEAMLERTFGDTYRAYSKRVRRWL